MTTPKGVWMDVMREEEMKKTKWGRMNEREDQS